MRAQLPSPVLAVERAVQSVLVSGSLEERHNSIRASGASVIEVY